jgi:hypothetical protein
MEFVQLREADIQKDLRNMDSEMAHLSRNLSSSIDIARKQANAQLAKSRKLSSQLKASSQQNG